jgi:hypothetical protein
MKHDYSQAWVEAKTAETMEQWSLCAATALPAGTKYTAKEHRAHEKAYDKGLRAVEREGRRAARTSAMRLETQRRIVALFPQFAAVALGLSGAENQLITGSFLPMGTELARWSRRFDRTLSNAGILQACRNAWTCCGLQALLGKPMELTPAVLAYSLLYPYSDNYLDHPGMSSGDKLDFSKRFRRRLLGAMEAPDNGHEASVWSMVQLIEDQHARLLYPQVYDCLLAIHRAQEDSIAQLKNGTKSAHESLEDGELLRISCAKGGTSVLADACLVEPLLSPEAVQLSFQWGVLLQLGDDLQDVREDLRRGSITLFTRAVAQGKSLDGLIGKLLNFSNQIADRMDRMRHGSSALKSLLRMSWRSLILMAVADVQGYCSPAFLADLEPSSSFRFKFLGERSEQLAEREAFYDVLFEAFLEGGAGERSRLPMPRTVGVGSLRHAGRPTPAADKLVGMTGSLRSVRVLLSSD